MLESLFSKAVDLGVSNSNKERFQGSCRRLTRVSKGVQDKNQCDCQE